MGFKDFGTKPIRVRFRGLRGIVNNTGGHGKFNVAELAQERSKGRKYNMRDACNELGISWFA